MEGKSKKNKSLSTQGFYYLIYNLLNIVFPFFSGLYIARILLPVNIGEITAAQNLADYFTILAFLGIPTYGLREISKTKDNYEEMSKVFSELFFINFFSTIIFCFLYLNIILIIPQYRSHLILYLIVGISIFFNFCNVNWLFEGLEEFKFISIKNLIFKTVSFLMIINFVKEQNDYLIYAGITVFSTIGSYITNAFYAPNFVILTNKNLNFKRHLKSIIFLMSVNLAIEIYTLMDVTMMSFICEKDRIAFYKYGTTIEKILLQIVNTFTMVLVPRITYYYKENKKEDYNKLLSKGLKYILVLSIPMIIGIFFTSDFLITQLYGIEYISSSMVLKIISVLLFVTPVGYLLGSRVLLTANKEDKMVYCVSTGAIINFLSNMILIPKHNEIGAAISSVISEIAVMTLYLKFGKRHFTLVNLKESVIKISIGASIMLLYLFICVNLEISEWSKLIIQILGSVLIYGSSLILLKEEITIDFIKKAKKRI